MSGAIPVGSWLRQETLAMEFGVSRTPVREALRKLEARGVVPRTTAGCVGSGPDGAQVRETYQIRAELEGLAAELAATRINDEQLKRLRDAEELFRRSVQQLVKGSKIRPKAGDEDWFRANTLFHDVVQEAGANDRLRLAIADLHRTFPRNLTWSALRENVRLLQENIEQHQRIREAVVDGSPERARREMRDHVRRAGELVCDWFERQASPSASP